MKDISAKHRILLISLGLVLCSMLLAGMGYVFMRTLENSYEDQAYATLHGSSASVAHALYTGSIDAQEYLQTTAHNFAHSLENDPSKNTDKNLQMALKYASKYNFLGFIDNSGKMYLAGLAGAKVYFDDVTKKNLMLGDKSLYALGYIDNVGTYLLLHTAPVVYEGKHYGLLFSGMGHSSMRTLISLQPLHDGIRYSILDTSGVIHGGTAPFISAGENMLDVWDASPGNSSSVLRRIAQSLKIGRKDFEKISVQGVPYYMSFTPTLNNRWMIVASMPESEVIKRLSGVIYVVVGAAIVWFVFCGLVLYFIVRIQAKERKNAEHYANRLQWLFDEIPCGVVRFKDDENWTVLEYGRSLLTSLGITEEEIRVEYGSNWSKMIHPKDLWNVKQNLQALSVNTHEHTILEYRLLLSEKKTVWVLETTRVMEDSTGRWYWSIITNITERKKSELYNQKTSERYKQIFENFEKILYEYDWAKKELRTTQQFFKKFGYPLPDMSADYYTVDMSIIHPDDMENFNDMQFALQTGKKTAENLVRIKDEQGSWFWCQMRQNSWVDHDDNSVKAIGEIKNVDEETRSLQKLRDDVQRDAFTGLYNKIATAELIERELTLESTQRGVLCIVDVDNFKQVNDSLGHARGDAVIKDISSGLSRIFRSDDVVGRIGGDEFLVYIKNMPKLGALLVKLDNVLKFFRQTLEDDGVEVEISCSIGIALFPKDGNTYQELYNRADKALYRSKKRKGIYTFYDSKIDV